MLSFIGTDSYTSLSQELLKETANIASLHMSPTISKYLNKLQQNKERVSIKTNNHISLKKYIQGFEKWKELTTTSPSRRHLCHHHSLPSLDGNQCNKDKEHFSDRIWKIITVSHQLLSSMEKP